MKISAIIELIPAPISVFRNANLEYVEEIAILSIDELKRRTGLDMDSCNLIQKIAFEVLSPKCYYPLDLISTQVFLSSGDNVLDKLLNGGYLCGQITEIYGISSAGKSHFALQAAITAQLPIELGGLHGHVAFIVTDHVFPIHRFMHLVNYYCKLYPCLSTESILDRVHVLQIRDLETQARVISYQLPHFIKENHIKLLIIDSIGCNFRCDQLTMNSRAAYINDMGRNLKSMAEKFQLVVLCTNQVTDSFQSTQFLTISASKGPHHFKITEINNGCSKIPALGLIWSNFVNTRIQLSKISKYSGHENEPDELIRTFTIVFSNYLPSKECRFGITKDGVIGIK